MRVQPFFLCTEISLCLLANDMRTLNCYISAGVASKRSYGNMELFYDIEDNSSR